IAVPRTDDEAGHLRGYVSPCDRSRGDSQQQFFFLNGRAVRDPTLLSAVRQAYANLLPPRRHPTAVLWLDLDPADVDVNVHPQKADVRFKRDREVFHLVVRAVRTALQRGGLVAELHLARRPEAPPAPRVIAPAPSPSRAVAAAMAVTAPPPSAAPVEPAPRPALATLPAPAPAPVVASAPGRFFQ